MAKQSKAKLIKSKIAKEKRNKHEQWRLPAGINLRVRKRSNLDIWIDLDGTLIQTESYAPLIIKRRPFLRQFLRYCWSLGQKVSFFTANEDKFAEEKFTLAGIPMKNIYSRSDIKELEVPHDREVDFVVQFGGSLIKTALIKIVPDFDKDRTIIIDDCSMHYDDIQRVNVL